MSIFNKKKQFDTQFRTRAEAFNAMLAYLIEDKGVEPLEAARQANEFATLFADNMGIPAKIEPELKGVDKYISIAEKIGDYAQKNPRVVELALGGITFIAGLFTGKKVEEHEQVEEEQKKEPIDFDKIPD